MVNIESAGDFDVFDDEYDTVEKGRGGRHNHTANRPSDEDTARLLAALEEDSESEFEDAADSPEEGKNASANETTVVEGDLLGLEDNSGDVTANTETVVNESDDEFEDEEEGSRRRSAADADADDVPTPPALEQEEQEKEPDDAEAKDDLNKGTVTTDDDAADEVSDNNASDVWPLVIYAASSFMFLCACVTERNNGEFARPYFAYGLSLGVVGSSMAFLALVLARRSWQTSRRAERGVNDDDDKNTPYETRGRPFLRGLLFAWAFSGVCVFTFGCGWRRAVDVFARAGNGYFAVWAMLISSLWYCGATGEAIKRRSIDFCTAGLAVASLVIIVELSLQIKSCWYLSVYSSNNNAGYFCGVGVGDNYNYNYPPDYPPYEILDDYYRYEDEDDEFAYLDDYYYSSSSPTNWHSVPPTNWRYDDDFHYHDDHNEGYYHDHYHGYQDDDYWHHIQWHHNDDDNNDDFALEYDDTHLEYNYRGRRNNKRLLMPYSDFFSSSGSAALGDSYGSVPSYEGVAVFALALSVLTLVYALVAAAIPIYTDGLTTASSRTGAPRRCNATVQLCFVAVFSVSWFLAACLTTFIGPFTAAGNGYFAVWGAFACSVSAVLILKKQIRN